MALTFYFLHRYLYLNSLTGAVPAELAGCGNALTTLDLSHNQLSGPLPPALFPRLRALRELNLGANRLSGELPASVGAGSFGVASNVAGKRAERSAWDGRFGLTPSSATGCSAAAAATNKKSSVARAMSLRVGARRSATRQNSEHLAASREIAPRMHFS